MLSSLCHIWWICSCVESFALVLKWGGPGVRRKGLPQASAAVWWSVTGSFLQPTGTKTTLWSVSISDLPGCKKSAQNIFIHMVGRYTPDIYPKSNPKSLHTHCFFLLLVFMSSRLAINICCSPARLREDIYWKIDVCFRQYCSNFLLSHGGSQTDIDRH